MVWDVPSVTWVSSPGVSPTPLGSRTAATSGVQRVRHMSQAEIKSAIKAKCLLSIKSFNGSLLGREEQSWSLSNSFTLPNCTQAAAAV